MAPERQFSRGNGVVQYGVIELNSHFQLSLIRCERLLPFCATDETGCAA